MRDLPAKRTLDGIKQILLEQEQHFKETYVHIVGVFGSYVRGEERSDSDIDILVELERPPRLSLIDIESSTDMIGLICTLCGMW